MTFGRSSDADGYWAGHDFVYQDGDHIEPLKLDMWMAPHTPLPVTHTHPRQVEYFRVVSGHFDVKVGRKLSTLTPGDAITIGAGTYHAVGNASEESAVVYAEITPGLRTQSFFNELRQLEDLRLNGLAMLMHYGKLVRRYNDEYHYSPPVTLLFGASALFARVFSRNGQDGKTAS